MKSAAIASARMCGHAGSDGHRRCSRVGDAVVRPMFPKDNVWNVAIDQLPVDANSAAYVTTIGATKTVHPDFGTVYNGAPNGIPYVVVTGAQPRVAVSFTYASESDPGPYPIPAQCADRRRPAEHGRPPCADRGPRRRQALRIIRGLSEYGRQLARRVGSHLRPRQQRVAPGHVDIGRCGRLTDPPRSRALRGGIRGRDCPCVALHGAADPKYVHLAGATPGVEPARTLNIRRWDSASA